MLFQIDMAGGAPAEVYPHFWKEHETEIEVKAFAQGLVEGVIREREALDRIIAGSVDNWRIERMAVVDRNILRLACAEMRHDADTPAPLFDNIARHLRHRWAFAARRRYDNGRVAFIDRHPIECAINGRLLVVAEDHCATRIKLGRLPERAKKPN